MHRSLAYDLGRAGAAPVWGTGLLRSRVRRVRRAPGLLQEEGSVPKYKVGDLVQISGQDTIYRVTAVHAADTGNTYDIQSTTDSSVTQSNVPEGALVPVTH